MIRRPPGLELDLGGSVKGWAADFVVARLARHGRCAVDCGGDLRVAAGSGAPWEVRVRHPLTGAIAHTLRVRAGGVATSGIDARLWERPEGDFAHHLIDPATGSPAWTGLVAATALAPTALEAEALAKAALALRPRRWATAAAEPPRRGARARRRRGRAGGPSAAVGGVGSVLPQSSASP